MAPGPEAIRSQLDRILAAETFAGAGRHSRLLKYIVERALAGEGDRLKEYVLATEVLDRPDTYDPRLDSIVRVEVRRLRRRLEEYYRGPGSADPVIVTIPRGSYAPEFSLHGAAPHEIEPDRVEGRRRLPRRAAWVAIGATVLLALTFATLRPQRDSPSSAHAGIGPGILVLPFESYSTAPDEQLRAARLTDAVMTELVKLGTVSVASRTSASRYAGQGHRIGELAAELGVQFVIEARAVTDSDRLRVVVRLVDAAIDRKVWMGEYELWPGDIPIASAVIAADVAAAVQASRDTRP